MDIEYLFTHNAEQLQPLLTIQETEWRLEEAHLTLLAHCGAAAWWCTCLLLSSLSHCDHNCPPKEEKMPATGSRVRCRTPCCPLSSLTVSQDTSRYLELPECNLLLAKTRAERTSKPQQICQFCLKLLFLQGFTLLYSAVDFLFCQIGRSFSSKFQVIEE